MSQLSRMVNRLFVRGRLSMKKSYMKPGINILLLLAIVFAAHSASGQEQWRSLFDGKTLKGWKANVYPESFSVVDGVIRARSVKDRSHLFYVGDKTDGFERYKNFELEAMARGEPGSNSGIFFHTDFAVRDQFKHLANGYEVQLNKIGRASCRERV